MLQPTQHVYSIQGTFNEIGIVNGMDEEAVRHVPSNLKCTVRDDNVQVRSYSYVQVINALIVLSRKTRPVLTSILFGSIVTSFTSHMTQVLAKIHQTRESQSQ